MNGLELRLVRESDLDVAYSLESACYPPEAAATREAFRFRERHFPNYFWSAWDGGSMVGLACGVRTSSGGCGEDEVKSAHEAERDGPHLCILSVAVDSAYRRGGIGTALMRALLGQAEKDRLQAVILMCESHLLSFYRELGFRYVGISSSNHGGIEWHEMKKDLQKENLAPAT